MRACMGHLTTWSAYMTFKKEHPDEPDPLDNFYKQAMSALGLEDPDQSFEISFEIFGFLAKAPVQGN